jgi:hypothetical protein
MPINAIPCLKDSLIIVFSPITIVNDKKHVNISVYKINRDYHSIVYSFIDNLRNSGIESINLFLVLNTDSP